MPAANNNQPASAQPAAPKRIPRAAALAFAAFNVALLVLCCAIFARTGSASARPPRIAPSAEPMSSVDRSSAIEPGVHVDRAPRLGKITVGAFAPEAVPGLNMSIESLDRDPVYARYRSAVRQKYGADLADMNYLGIGVSGWQPRCDCFEDWLLRAGKYGDPTIAIEPIGSDGYEAFRDDAEMRRLRRAFAKADRAGIVVWVRFASESNDGFNPYSVCFGGRKLVEYRRSVHWFRRYMPHNVRLVFSPLINKAYQQSPGELETLKAMYEPGAYDRIGGTLYATSWVRPKDAFDWYYRFMRSQDTTTPFEVCELGGTYPRSDEVKAFLVRAARGDWPGVQRVNLFAGDLNSVAVSNHGHFGLVLPGRDDSYLSDLFDGEGASARYEQIACGPGLALLEQIGASWESGDMTLDGTIVRVVRGQAKLDMTVDSVTDDIGDTDDLAPPRQKRVLITPECEGARALDAAAPGATIHVTGWDNGSGTPLRATSVALD